MSLYKEIKKIPEAMRLKTKIEIYNLILQKQIIHQTQPPSLTESHPSNHASTSFIQPLTRTLTYPKYDYTAPYDMRQNHDHIISNQNRVPTNYTTVHYNQNMVPPGTPSPLSESSQGSSDLYICE
jgi:hypothetical protein